MNKIFLTFLIGFPLLHAEMVETIFGNIELEEPLLLDLLHSKAVQRMKEIDQSGIVRYFDRCPPFSRYDHSMGVLYLLRHYGASIKEQAAGILHDTSHTVFSHVGDMVFDHQDGKESHQDLIHSWYLERAGFSPLLDKYQLEIKEILHKNISFTMLEQDLPDVCIDRFEYNLHTAYLFNLISKEEMKVLIDDLFFEEGKWGFKSIASAKRLANLSLYFTEHFWGSDWNSVMYHWTSLAIKQALRISLLNVDDIYFSTDSIVLNTLLTSPDPEIQMLMTRCKSPETIFKYSTSDNFDFYMSPKCRVINPWVKQGEEWVRFDQLDSEFAKEWARVIELTNTGAYLSFAKQQPEALVKIAKE